MSSSSDLPHSCHKILALHVESVSTANVFSLLLQITLHLLKAYFAVALPSEHIMPIVFELLVLIQFLMAFCNLCMLLATANLIFTSNEVFINVNVYTADVSMFDTLRSDIDGKLTYTA